MSTNGNGNGNGTANAAVIEAQRAVERTLKPLQEAEKRAASTRLRLAECEQVLALAQSAFAKAESAYVDNDSVENGRALRSTREAMDAAQSRVKGFAQKLAEDEAAIVPLQQTHDAAAVALAQVQLQANYDAAENDVHRLEIEIYNANALVLQLTNQMDTANQRRLRLFKELDANRMAAVRAQNAAHAAAHPTSAQTAFTRTRAGW